MNNGSHWLKQNGRYCASAGHWIKAFKLCAKNKTILINFKLVVSCFEIKKKSHLVVLFSKVFFPFNFYTWVQRDIWREAVCKAMFQPNILYKEPNFYLAFLQLDMCRAWVLTAGLTPPSAAGWDLLSPPCKEGVRKVGRQTVIYELLSNWSCRDQTGSAAYCLTHVATIYPHQGHIRQLPL